MTQIHDPTDDEAFLDGLTALLRLAVEHGVDIERAWQCRIDAEVGWEVEVVPLSPKDSSE
jgi:hypothetical protein